MKLTTNLWSKECDRLLSSELDLDANDSESHDLSLLPENQGQKNVGGGKEVLLYSCFSFEYLKNWSCNLTAGFVCPTGLTGSGIPINYSTKESESKLK